MSACAVAPFMFPSAPQLYSVIPIGSPAAHSRIRGIRRTLSPIHDSSTYFGSHSERVERLRRSCIAVETSSLNSPPCG